LCVWKSNIWASHTSSSTPSLHLAGCIGLGGLRDQTAATVIVLESNHVFGVMLSQS
jgi:hypothetical protein